MQVVIIGAGQGGLTAAIYARLLGCDVLLLEAGSQVGGKAASISLGDYRLDPGPSIVILPRIYEGVFQDAGRRMDDYLRFRRLDPISRVLFEGQPTVDLSANLDEAHRLVKEVAPEDAVAFRRLMSTLARIAPHVDQSIFKGPYERAWQFADHHLMAMALHFDVRATYKEIVDARFRSPFLRAFFYGFPSYGGQTYDSKAPGALLIPYFMLQEGVYYPEGGVGAIPAALHRLATELGVETRFGCRVNGLRHNGKWVQSVVLESGETIEANRVISNVDRTTTQSWLGQTTEAAPSLSYFTIHLGIRKRIAGLGHHTLLVPKDYEDGFIDLYRNREFPKSPIVYLNNTTLSDPDVAPLGATNLFAVVTAPAEDAAGGTDSLHRERVLRQMGRFGIDFSASEVDFERIQSPRYFEQAHGNYRGSLYGVDEKYRPFGGLFPQTNRDGAVRNLFYCGGSVQPGAGLPMVTLSGKFAAGAAAC